jgi:hypothetical protein
MIDTPEGPRWFGMYPGVILKTDEGESRANHAGRCKVHVPMVHGSTANPDKLPWAMPCFPTPINFQEGAGLIHMPSKGDTVYVFFEGGVIDAPVWMGGYVPAGRIPTRAKYGQGYKYPKVTLLKTKLGQCIRLIDGESVEIFAGASPSGDHTEYDSYIKIDLRRKRAEIKSKYRCEFTSKQKITVRAPDIKLEARKEMENTGAVIVSPSGTDASGSPVITPGAGTTLTISCTDASGATGGFAETSPGSGIYAPVVKSSRIRMTPTSVTCQTEHVRGFKG